MDAGTMGLVARAYAAQNKNIDEAYRYAVSLIRAFPANVESWNTLAVVVRAKEGDENALEILERVGRVAEDCSELFLHLGDLRAKAGLNIGAAQAYRKAIALSEDGMVIKKQVERKLKKRK
jgi:predicted RNA polymerase sigma factor